MKWTISESLATIFGIVGYFKQTAEWKWTYQVQNVRVKTQTLGKLIEIEMDAICQTLKNLTNWYFIQEDKSISQWSYYLWDSWCSNAT